MFQSRICATLSPSSSLLLSSLELTDTKVYEPQVRVLLLSSLEVTDTKVYEPQTREEEEDIGKECHQKVAPPSLVFQSRICATPFVLEKLEREIFIDNLLVRVHWIIEMIVVERPCAMGVRIPDFQVALYLPSQVRIRTTTLQECAAVLRMARI